MSEINASLKAKARIVKIIGKELISNETVALVEMVKNSYDADASEVKIIFKDIFSDKGVIWIEDDGIGMSDSKVINVWMELATPDKNVHSLDRFSKCSKRKMLGEKGIGRFAAHNLGNKIKLITRATEDCNVPLDYEIQLEIDWNKFEQDVYLGDIPITIEKRIPTYFKKSTGTLIIISDIGQWNVKKLKEVVLKLRGLETPSQIKVPQTLIPDFEENNKYKRKNFEIKIESNEIEIQKVISGIPSLSEILTYDSFYTFSGNVNTKGVINYTYKFNKPGYSEFSRVLENKKVDLKNSNEDFFENILDSNALELLSPGNFDVNFFAWDLDSASLKIAGLAGIYKEIIKPNGGVRIYRDGFRVWPYGEEDDDWLGLDLERLNAPKERYVSRNQIIGFVSISSYANAELIDQSNREGLIKNRQYELFYEYVRASLKEFARLRMADKSKIDKATKKKDWEDDVIKNINAIKTKIHKNKHDAIYSKNIDLIEHSYKEKIDEIVDRYMLAAALGISYTLPIHEINLRLSSIHEYLDKIQKDPELLDKYLKELIRIIDNTEDVVKAVGNVIGKQKKQKQNLKKLVEYAFNLKSRELEKYEISFEINGPKDIEIEILKGLIITALMNLIDNSIYWIRVKRNEMRMNNLSFKGLIICEIGHNEKGLPYLRIKDNGTGIDDPLDLLTEPYYSKKSDGLGLGLYLVNEIMKRHNGYIEAYNEDGAVFELIFSGEAK